MMKEKPPPPGNCSASKISIFNKAIFTKLRSSDSHAQSASLNPRDLICEQPPAPANAADLPFHDGSADRFRPNHPPLRPKSGERVLIDSGRIIHRSGLNPGRVVTGKV